MKLYMNCWDGNLVVVVAWLMSLSNDTRAVDMSSVRIRSFAGSGVGLSVVVVVVVVAD